ncbi:uncharacterized protein ACN427_000862 [Glossina fuscipes fuscipes]
MAMLRRLTTRTTTTAGANPPRTLQKFQNCIAFLIPSWHNLTQKKSTQVDAIDCFTNELVLRRCKKWEELKENVCQSLNQKDSSVSCSTTNLRESMHMMSKAIKTDFEALRSPKLVLDIRSLSQAQLDNLLISTVEIKNKLDFLYLVQQCIRWQYLPSNEVLIASLKYLSTLSAVQQIESFLEICKQQKHPLLEAYTDFAPFKAMALWRHGRSDMALTTLHQGYDKALQALHHQALHGHHQELLQHIQGYDSSNLMASNGNGKRMIRAAFRTIIEETLIKKSDAVLVSLMEIAHAIYSKHNDIFVIACVWKQCFASEWFCDQKSATDLFESNVDLQQLVAKKSGSLVTSFLSHNNLDAVHRIIELFLQYKEREACFNCLSLLFGYHHHHKDLRACAEIVKSCNELSMPLNETQNEQFLYLFLNQENNGGISQSTGTTHRKSLKKFQYKF